MKQELTKEQLENICNQLSAQNNALKQDINTLQDRLQAAEGIGFFKRMDYLWAVISTQHMPEEFRERCVKEFQEMMFPPEEDNDAKEG